MLKAKSPHALNILNEWEETKESPTILGGLAYGHLPIEETRRIACTFDLQDSLVDQYAPLLQNPPFDEHVSQQLKSLPYPPNSTDGEQLVYAITWLTTACLAEYLHHPVDSKISGRDLQSEYERAREKLAKHLTEIDKTISSVGNPLVRHAIYNGLVEELKPEGVDVTSFYGLAHLAKNVQNADLMEKLPKIISDESLSRRKDTFVRDASIRTLAETWILCFGVCPTTYGDSPFMESLRLFLNYTKISHLGDNDSESKNVDTLRKAAQKQITEIKKKYKIGGKSLQKSA